MARRRHTLSDMRGHERQDDALRAFISARTQDLHHDAYQLTAGQAAAERLVVAVLTDLQRQRLGLSRAGVTAHLRMVQTAARDNTPTEIAEDSRVPERFRALIRLSPRQRAALVLHTDAGYDDRAIARALQLSTRATAETLRSIPCDVLPGATSRSNELRSLLEDFGDLATSPSATATIRQVHAASAALGRPWWTYAAAALVIALTATCVVVAQGWHNDWLKTPEGLNHAHGTHFPAYIHGYQLVDVRNMTPGIAQNVTAGAAGAVALPCGLVEPTMRLSVQSAASERTEGDSCPESATGARLTPVKGRSSAMVLNGKRDTYPIAVYRKVPISEYPVATTDFEVQHDVTLDDVRREMTEHGKQQSGNAKGRVLTLHGTAAHPNGTFKGNLTMPSGSFDDEVDAVGLLSPTTTGQFRVHISGVPPITNCSDEFPSTYDSPGYRAECSLVDQQVPQVKFRQTPVLADGGETVPVEITVKNAIGPWTLQVVAVRYLIGTGLDF